MLSGSRQIFSRSALRSAAPWARSLSAAASAADSSTDFAWRRLSQLFEAVGNSAYIGEPVSIVTHSIESAFMARDMMQEQYPDTSEEALDVVTVAALLHDIGHALGLEAGLDLSEEGIKTEQFLPTMDGCGVVGHETLGCDFAVELGFSPTIGRLIASHVDAKRYMCWKDPEYFAGLSPASVVTLGFQGGPFTDAEGEGFERDPLCAKMVLLRRVDEAAKVPGLEVPPLAAYKDLICRLAPTARPYQVSGPQREAFAVTGRLRLYDMTSEALDDAVLQLQEELPGAEVMVTKDEEDLGSSNWTLVAQQGEGDDLRGIQEQMKKMRSR